MADGNFTVEGNTQAAQYELQRLRDENAALKREAYTWWQLAASAPQDERKRCVALCKAQAERWEDDRARYAALECAKAIESQVPT
jgi:hypothetical protein